MKTKLFSILAISALLFASCSNDNDEVGNNEPQAVRFTAGIDQTATPATRAAGTTWAANDAIGVFMVENGSITIAEGAVNRQHKTADGTSFAPVAGDEIYYPVSGAAVDFIAYYPYLASQTLGNYSVDVASQKSQPAIDLLWSKASNFSKVSSGNVGLAFNHKLSKVIIKTSAGDGLSPAQLQDMAVTIKGMNTKADFDLSTGALGISSEKANIIPFTASKGIQYEAIVLPAAFDPGNLTMTFKIGNDTFTWKNPDDATNGTFEAGKEYTYTMTISRTGVDFECTIKPWKTVSRTGTAN